MNFDSRPFFRFISIKAFDIKYESNEFFNAGVAPGICSLSYSRCYLLAMANISHYFRQLLDAILYCHENDVVHRDIRPAQIVVCHQYGSQPIKLGGFGMAIQLPEGVDGIDGGGMTHL